MDRKLKASDVTDAAVARGIEPAAIHAVADVESAGSGFLRDGRPKILFEGHVFWRRLAHHGHDPEALSSPATTDVLYPRWTREHYVGGSGEWDRLERARSIDPTEGTAAAYESASYGRFQVMGYHWRKLGYATLGVYLQEMHRDEAAHLGACLRYVDAFGLMDALRAKDWRSFAEGYNGPGQVDVYAARLKVAYEVHAGSTVAA